MKLDITTKKIPDTLSLGDKIIYLIHINEKPIYSISVMENNFEGLEPYKGIAKAFEELLDIIFNKPEEILQSITMNSVSATHFCKKDIEKFIQDKEKADRKILLVDFQQWLYKQPRTPDVKFGDYMSAEKVLQEYIDKL